MTGIRRGRHILIALVAAATLAAAAVPATGGAAVTAPPPPAGAALPADWPSDVPLPAGELQGSTGGNGLWTVELLVNGSAAQVLQSALDFYGAAGYATVSTGVLLRGTHQLTLVTENRDHSNAHTFLVIGLQEVPAQPSTGATGTPSAPAPAASPPAPAAPDPAAAAPAAPVAPTAPAPAAAPTAPGAPAATAGLPPDWPSDIPLPPGTVEGSTGSAGQWSVQLLVRGSAADALTSTVAFYVARGFRAQSNAVVVRGPERIVVVTENRDHSATQTTVVLGVSRSSAPQRPALVPTVLPGPKTVRLSRARRSGLRVRFTAPAGARRAVVRALRLVRGGRRLAGSAGATVHAGRATVALRSAAFRRHVVAGTYVLELVLHGAGGAAGRPVTTRVRVVR